MSQKTDAQLQTQRGVIENETAAGANTAVRVGDMFEDIIDSKANNVSPTLTGTPLTPTAAPGTNTTQIASTAFVAAAVGGGSGHVIEDEGTPLTQRANLNFVGAGVSAADAGGKTVVTIAGPNTAGHVIEDEGTPLTQRANMNFVGAGVTVTDAGGKTVVTIPSGSVSDGDKGDITVSASGATWTVDNDVITDAKLAAAVKPIGVQDLFIPAASMWPRVTGGCQPLTQTEMATSLFNIQSLDFDQTTQEFAQFQIVLPRKYNNGTVTFVPYWTAAAGSGTVQWGVSLGAYRNDDALTVALGTPQTSDDTLIATNDLHIGPESSAITVAGTLQDANFLAIQISRNPASDTLSGDAKLLGISLRITVDAAKDA